MPPLFAGLVEGAIIGAVAGALVGVGMTVIAALRPGKPCPQCQKPLPKPMLGPVKSCPKCGCKLNPKGEKLDEGSSAR
jgi:hypothetical protein